MLILYVFGQQFLSGYNTNQIAWSSLQTTREDPSPHLMIYTAGRFRVDVDDGDHRMRPLACQPLFPPGRFAVIARGV